tara:strand:+ start:1041 stop:1337 length:297 start_codon:yes stop_codon:yes gene_type:complete
MKKLDHYLEKAISNIESDRSITRQLLDDVMSYIARSEEHHKEVGLIASKYVETLQRSNEQLVKVSNIIHKKQNESEVLSSQDREELFDLIQQEATSDG